MDINFNLEDFVPEDSALDNSLIEQNEEQEETVEQQTTSVNDEPVVQQTQEEDNSDYEPDAQAAFETFKRLGVIDEDKFDGSFESIQTALEEREQNRTAEVAQAFIEQAPEKYRKLLQLVYNEIDDNDGDVSADKLQEFVDAFKEDGSVGRIRDEDDARNFLEKIYLDKGMRPAAVKAQLDDLEMDDELIDEAKKEMKVHEEKRQNELLKQQEERYNEIEQKREVFMQHLDKEFQNSGWQPQRVNIVKNTLAQTKDIMAKVSSSPKAVMQFADFLSHYKNGEFDVESYSKQAASKQVQQFKDNIVKSSFRNKTTDKRPGTVGGTLLKDFIPV
jgi:hypothetical protein